MSTEEDWIHRRVKAAKAAVGASEQADAEALEQLIRDRMLQRSLRPAEAVELASQLLTNLEQKEDDAP
jgi:hypothetical protein